MQTVKVFFANLGKTMEVKVNAQTSDVLRWLYRDNEVYCCHRNSDDEILLANKANNI